jgi:hypothetical protein
MALLYVIFKYFATKLQSRRFLGDWQDVYCKGLQYVTLNLSISKHPFSRVLTIILGNHLKLPFFSFTPGEFQSKYV